MVTSRQADRIQKSAEKVATAKDFASVSAVLEPFEDLKIKWMRTSDRIEFHACDFIRNASARVQEDLFSVIIDKIRGDMDSDYSDETVQYLTSEKFRTDNSKLFRERNLAYLNEEVERRIAESVDRLGDLIPEGSEGVAILASDKVSIGALRPSVLMRTVLINGSIILNAEPRQLDAVLLYSLHFVAQPFRTPIGERKAHAYEMIAEAGYGNDYFDAMDWTRKEAQE